MINHFIAIAMLALVLSITPEIIEEMREWVSDCCWLEDDSEIEEMSDRQIVMGVARHFDGGLVEFLNCHAV